MPWPYPSLDGRPVGDPEVDSLAAEISGLLGAMGYLAHSTWWNATRESRDGSITTATRAWLAGQYDAVNDWFQKEAAEKRVPLPQRMRPYIFETRPGNPGQGLPYGRVEEPPANLPNRREQREQDRADRAASMSGTLAGPRFTEARVISVVQELHARGNREVTPEMALDVLDPSHLPSYRRDLEAGLKVLDLPYPSIVFILTKAGQEGTLRTVGEGGDIRSVVD